MTGINSLVNIAKNLNIPVVETGVFLFPHCKLTEIPTTCYSLRPRANLYLRGVSQDELSRTNSFRG